MSGRNILHLLEVISSFIDANLLSPPLVHHPSFSLAASLGVGTSVRSDIFSAGGLYWQVEVFPAGIDDAHREHVAVAVHVAGDEGLARQVRVLHSIAVLDQVGGSCGRRPCLPQLE